MENKRVIPKWLGIVNIILIINGIAWTVYSMFVTVAPEGHGVESQVIHAMTILLLVFAMLYCLTGYKKNSAKFFKAFLYLYTLVSFASILLTRTGPAFLPMLEMLSFGILCILSVSKNLGADNSLVLSIANVVISLGRNVAYAVIVRQLPGALVGNLLLAVILGSMVYAKYADKASRGTD